MQVFPGSLVDFLVAGRLVLRAGLRRLVGAIVSAVMVEIQAQSQFDLVLCMLVARKADAELEVWRGCIMSQIGSQKA